MDSPQRAAVEFSLAWQSEYILVIPAGESALVAFWVAEHAQLDGVFLAAHQLATQAREWLADGGITCRETW
jgi:hypothetical protein